MKLYIQLQANFNNDDHFHQFDQSIQLNFSDFLRLGFEKIVEQLIGAGADVGVKGERNWTALHVATFKGMV